MNIAGDWKDLKDLTCADIECKEIGSKDWKDWKDGAEQHADIGACGDRQ